MTKLISARVPLELADAIEAEAAKTGLSVNEVVNDALAGRFSFRADPMAQVLRKALLFARRLDKRAFPQDVTLRAVREIRDRHRRIYDAAIMDSKGAVDQRRRAALHRRIGLTVKRTLGAKVVGRSLALDPAVELISSCALLAPV